MPSEAASVRARPLGCLRFLWVGVVTLWSHRTLFEARFSGWLAPDERNR